MINGTSQQDDSTGIFPQVSPSGMSRPCPNLAASVPRRAFSPSHSDLRAAGDATYGCPKVLRAAWAQRYACCEQAPEARHLRKSAIAVFLSPANRRFMPA
jgi:hypothetical protein